MSKSAKVMRLGKQIGLALLKGPGLALAEHAISKAADVLGKAVFPILGLVQSLGKLVVASYRLY